MGEIKRFEDIIAWQKARELTSEVYRLSREEPLATDIDFARRIRHSSLNIMTNIAEGYELRDQAEFLRCLGIARTSCAQVRSLIYVARDSEFVDIAGAMRLLGLAKEVGWLTGALYRAVEKQVGKVVL